MADMIRVTCSECRKRSEVMQPADDHDGPIVWKCPQPTDDGSLCGATNEVAA